MYLYFWYVNQNEHFDNVIYLKKHIFVVRVGKTCTDAIAYPQNVDNLTVFFGTLT